VVSRNSSVSEPAAAGAVGDPPHRVVARTATMDRIVARARLAWAGVTSGV
jgi:hypothetical protein